MLYPVLAWLAMLQDQVGDATSDPSDLFSGVGAAFVIALLLAVSCVAIAITWRNYRGLLKRSVRRRRRRRHRPPQPITLGPARTNLRPTTDALASFTPSTPAAPPPHADAHTGNP